MNIPNKITVVNDYKYTFNKSLIELQGMFKRKLYQNGEELMRVPQGTSMSEYYPDIDLTVYRGIFGMFNPHLPPLETIRMTVEEYNKLIAEGTLKQM